MRSEIAITIGMAVFFVRFFVRNMNEDEAREKLKHKT